MDQAESLRKAIGMRVKRGAGPARVIAAAGWDEGAGVAEAAAGLARALNEIGHSAYVAAEAGGGKAVESLAESGGYDYIIIAAPPGISEGVFEASAAAGETVIVTAPDQPSVTNAYLLIKSIKARVPGAVFWLMVNRAENEAGAVEAMDRIGQVTHKFLDLKLRKLGYILDNPRHAADGYREMAPRFADAT